MNNSEYWKVFYQGKRMDDPSSFARFCLPYIGEEVVDLGCGDGRDLYFFINNNIDAWGVDPAISDDINIYDMSVSDYIQMYPSPKYVYTRFFWHAITREEQLAVLDWTRRWLFIEARTTRDAERNKYFPIHDRNYVNVSQLVQDLKERNFEIEFLEEGTGMSTYKNEDPHLVRVIAWKR